MDARALLLRKKTGWMLDFSWCIRRSPLVSTTALAISSSLISDEHDQLLRCPPSSSRMVWMDASPQRHQAQGTKRACR
ncbi:hypothetical protein PG997_009270 [Apiospora hydei]|uniref:Uncharacterized protein n=1 Tax=Apiospora hydei TaxID=1337664 RepID=A0ABR1VTX3_9PEZI